MVTGGPIPTNMSPLLMTITEQGILTLAQWLSPAFPVGAFAYSHGLEWAIQSGRVRTAEDLESWLGDVLAYGSGRNDCILLRCAYACGSPEELEQVNQTAIAVASSRQRVMETELQGDAFGQTAASIWGGDVSALCYPVAVGRTAAQAPACVRFLWGKPKGSACWPVLFPCVTGSHKTRVAPRWMI